MTSGSIDRHFNQDPKNRQDPAIHPRFTRPHAVDDHPRAVDVLDLEPGDLGEPQANSIGGHEDGAVLEIADRLEEPDQFVGTEDDGESLGHLGAGHFLDDPMHTQGYAVEELQGGANLAVVAPGDVTLLDEVEQVRADLFGPEVLGRGVEVPGVTGDAADVLSDRPRREIAEDHVLGHTATKRCHNTLLYMEGGTRREVSPRPS